VLKEMGEDNTVPRNVKTSIVKIIEILNDETETSIKVDKVMHIFDELNEDSNIDPYTRTQLWNVVSMLESLN
jgi:uncharacterized protein (UPF0147 family)